MILIFFSLFIFLIWLLLFFVYKNDSDYLNIVYEICYCFNFFVIIVIVYIIFDNLFRRYIIRENYCFFMISEIILVFSLVGVVVYSIYGLFFVF